MAYSVFVEQLVYLKMKRLISFTLFVLCLGGSHLSSLNVSFGEYFNENYYFIQAYHKVIFDNIILYILLFIVCFL